MERKLYCNKIHLDIFHFLKIKYSNDTKVLIFVRIFILN